MKNKAGISNRRRIKTMTDVIDIREAPLYGISDAAYSVGIPISTLRAWVVGRPYRTGGRIAWSDRLIEPADKKRCLLSFANLAEAHVLQATREHRIPMRNVRLGLDYLRSQSPTASHPLLTQEFYAFRKELFIKHLREIVNVTKSGQLALDMLDPYLARLVRDNAGTPFRFFPMRNNDDCRVMVDVHISSGQPVLAHTGILASVVYGRNQCGESSAELARDYDIDERLVVDAIRYVAAA